MSFCVMALTDDRLDVIKKFVAYYLDQGADRISLYFDNPDSKLIKKFNHLDRVECHRCTEDFLKGLRRYLDHAGPAQNSIATFAYNNLQEDWLVRVDIDEYMHFPGRKIEDVLAQQPKSTEVFRPPVAEMLNTKKKNGALYFRKKMNAETVRNIYGDELDLAMQAQQGLAGHVESKVAIRKGLKNTVVMEHEPFQMSWFERNYKQFQQQWIRRKRYHEVQTEDGYLLHLNNEPFEIWSSKIVWRSELKSISPQMSRGFLSYFLNIASSKKSMTVEKALKQLYSRIFDFDQSRLNALKKAGALLELDLSLDVLVRRYFKD